MQLEPFKSVLDAQAAMWYYLEDTGSQGQSSDGASGSVQRGPMEAAEVAKHWDDGDIDGMTLVWHGAMPEWKPLAEVGAICYTDRR
jgi:hypothetical protein